MAQFVRSTVFGRLFETPARYTELEVLGTGIPRLVCSARDQVGQRFVALSKLSNPCGSANNYKHILMEIKLRKHLNHGNIVNLLDIFISPAEDIYLVTDLMKTDLETLLKAKPIENEFVQYLIYQIMRGLKYLHSAGVVHRDLKPSNILINDKCDLKIWNFGLAQVQGSCMTGYVATDYYMAPEVMLTWKEYGEKIDIWSAGCIFAEMLRGQPLFPRQNEIHQLHVITELLGTPSEDIISEVTPRETLALVQSLPKSVGKQLSVVFPDSDSKAIGLLEMMLVFDPRIRVSASEALTHPYLALYHDPEDEPEAERQFGWTSHGGYQEVGSLKAKIFGEVLDYHKQVELRDSVKQWAQSVSVTRS